MGQETCKVNPILVEGISNTDRISVSVETFTNNNGKCLKKGGCGFNASVIFKRTGFDKKALPPVLYIYLCPNHADELAPNWKKCVADKEKKTFESFLTSNPGTHWNKSIMKGNIETKSTVLEMTTKMNEGKLPRTSPRLGRQGGVDFNGDVAAKIRAEREKQTVETENRKVAERLEGEMLAAEEDMETMETIAEDAEAETAEAEKEKQAAEALAKKEEEEEMAEEAAAEAEKEKQAAEAEKKACDKAEEAAAEAEAKKVAAAEAETKKKAEEEAKAAAEAAAKKSDEEAKAAAEAEAKKKSDEEAKAAAEAEKKSKKKSDEEAKAAAEAEAKAKAAAKKKAEDDAKAAAEAEKEKQAVATGGIGDDILFMQPKSSHKGNCTICSLPIPVNQMGSWLRTCCYQVICIGCDYANQGFENEMRQAHRCPFCRKTIPNSEAESDDRLTRTAKPDNEVAMRLLGDEYRSAGNYNLAFESYTTAAALGDVEAEHMLSLMYHWGEGMPMDANKSVFHAQRAAIGGHLTSRYNLGVHERKNNRVERAIKHFKISAQLGHDDSMNMLWHEYQRSNISKNELELVLRKHHNAVEEMKSRDRKEASRILSSR